MKKEDLIEILKNKLKVYLDYVAVFLIILLVISLIRNLSQYKKSQEKISEKAVELERLREESDKLKVDLEEAESEFYQEKQIRDKLGLAKEGEIVVILPEDEILRKLAPPDEEEEETLPEPNWKKWANLFF